MSTCPLPVVTASPRLDTEFFFNIIRASRVFIVCMISVKKAS
jgi:hypothetical protein